MTVRVEVIAVLERYDDAAWSALASRGLLRRARKDLERLTPEVVAEGPDMLEVVVGDATVSFGPAGPPAARCTCPAGATCQHVITAALWLVAADPAAGGEVQSVSPGDELLRMSAGELRAAAGAAAYRWAREFVEELPADRFRVVEGHHLVLSLTSPRVSFHVTGGGLAGVVADVKLPNVERYQVAVVLAYQRANGVELEPVRTRAGLDGALAARRAAVREAVERLACDTVQVGVAHLSESLRQRYETLAVSAQGAEYYRLASMLRGLTGEVERVLTRSARADEQALLEQLATTYALVTALGTLGDLPRLVGTARGRFEASGRLELVGLGAVPWRTASGHAGLTVVLWSESEQQFVTWTDSRPPGVPFDPRARYTAPGPWSGVLNPAALTGARVTLLNARITPSGRLSGTEATHATCTPLTTPNLRPITRWSDLPSPHPITPLADPDHPRPYAVLAPTTYGTPHFDQAHQHLTWPLTDTQGATLTLHLPYTPESHQAITHLESLPPPTPPTLLLVHLHPQSPQPITLITPTPPAADAAQPPEARDPKPAAQPPVGAVPPAASGHPASADAESPGAAGRAAVVDGGGRPAGTAPSADAESPGGMAIVSLHFGVVEGGGRAVVGGVSAVEQVGGVVVGFWEWLVGVGERGVGVGFEGELGRRVAGLRGVGLGVYPAEGVGAAGLLRALYLTMRVLREVQNVQDGVVGGD